jgi:LmbE family N-acetylglucosaminyl deacetylase
MNSDLRLMTVLAHPDDESLGTGGALIKYGLEGVRTFIVSATRGERGRYGDLPQRPSVKELGRIRERELRDAAEKLGVQHVDILDYIDGELDRADPNEAVAKIVALLRRYRPQVVITFGPEGGYGHPDHVAISQFTTAAVVCAADPDYDGHGDIEIPPQKHRVDKLYYMAWTRASWEAFQAAFKTLKPVVDGVERQAVPTPDWAVTTYIDTSQYWEKVWAAVSCHQTQIALLEKMHNLPEEHHRAIWGTQEFYRVFSTVNGGRGVEKDIFEGLRPRSK